MSTMLVHIISMKVCDAFQIHMIGNNLALLYAHVPQEVLPAELGGDGPPYHMQSWAHQLIGKDENFSFGEKQIYWPDHGCGIK